MPLQLFRIAGDSMSPTLRPGQTVVGWGWFQPKVDDVVIIDRGQKLIKRIKRIEDETIWVEGDNSSYSTDSRHFGPIRRSQLLARVRG